MTKDRQSVLGRIMTFVAVAAVVIADQLTKLAAVKVLVRVGAGKTVIPGVLDFTYVLNSGATAGILSGHRWVFMTVSSVVIVAIVIYISMGRVKNTFTAISLAMIVGGGIGNMIDRVARGTVVDFIDVTLVDFFPFNTVFNVADVCVCVGCVLLIISVLVSEIREKKNSRAGTDSAAE